MKLSNFSVELHPLKEEHLELMRSWRNSDFVKQYLHFQGEITEEMQRNWFYSLNESNSYYFLMHNGSEYFGSCGLKNVNAQRREAEGTIFVGEERFVGGLDSIKAIFIMYEFAFSYLGVDKIVGDIISSNKRAIRFNKLLGFNIAKPDENGNCDILLTKENFNSALSKHESILNKSR
ncbi:GNAT family N-acetyltransferase [Pseudoalteromonas sp. XMcav1-K]|uniref:GNAT family N-acetyltransferase n=1 Tax=Pseudoalteromonas sp. XMcav1-K TaxID=3374372 RepID=UPI0037575402